MIGEMVSHYRILEKLGEGGMGEVFVAEDTRLGRKVALKFLPASFSRDLIAVERFRREARAASALNHPNICTVYDIGEHEGRPFISMELLEGVSLRERIMQGGFRIEQLVEFALQMVDALDAAHSKGIIHRDLKPPNLFITSRGQVKILDFGLAKHANEPKDTDSNRSWMDSRTTDSIDLTTPGAALGTVAYMSPEQARGDETGVQSDLFSIGAVLYEMATGRPAFTGKTSAVIYDAILNRYPQLPSAINSDVPPELDRVIMKLIEKDPELRYETAASVRVDLRRLRRAAESGARDSAGSAPVWSGRRPRQAAIATVSVILLALAIWYGVVQRGGMLLGSGEVSIRSLAVLPLENLSGNADQEYLADGLTEALIGDLARLQGLRVVSRTSVMRYKGAKKSLPEIARELNVDAVVEGSVMRSEERLRITAQLVHAKTDRHLWAETYDRQFSDILSVQSEVAQAIASQVRVNLTEQDRTRLQRRGPVNTDAHEAYLRGRRALQRFTPESLRHGLEYFRRAVQLDPNFAAGYSGIADAHTSLGVLNMVPPEEAFPEALSAANRALGLDETLSEAHVSLAYADLLYGWKFEEARQHFQRALELNPNSPEAHRGHSLYLAAMGRSSEAVEAAQKAVELDPLSPYFQTNLVFVLLLAGKTDDAIAAGEKTIAMDPAHPGGHFLLGIAYEAKGDYGKAISEFEKTSALSPIVSATLGRLSALALAGKKAEAKAALAQLLRGNDGTENPVSVAQVYASLGDHDRAFQWLARAEKRRQGGLIYLRTHPRFALLREDARFAGLAQRIGLPSPALNAIPAPR
jgi:TolB-like protein/Flp pilus assembly protein TadD/predicted Ser/Thr protein kinase